MTSFREIVRGAVSRFLPGFLLTLVAFPLLFAPRTFVELELIQIARLSGYTVAALAGYAASVLAMRSRFRPDAELVGRKSVVAGTCSVGAVLITSFLPHGLRSYATLMATYFAVSAGVTLVLFMPWLRTKADSPTSGVETAV